MELVGGFAERSELHRQRCGGGLNGATILHDDEGSKSGSYDYESRRRKLCLRGQREVVVS
jgi:hypothetical protein